MSKERDCATKLRAIVGKEPFQTFVAKVTKVDGATCTVQRLFDDMELEEVRLNCHSTENEAPPSMGGAGSCRSARKWRKSPLMPLTTPMALLSTVETTMGL